MSTEEDIHYFILQLDNWDEIVRFLHEDYFAREPLCRAARYKDDQLDTSRLGKELREALGSGCSFGARDRATGQLVGVCISGEAEVDAASSPDEGLFTHFNAEILREARMGAIVTGRAYQLILLGVRKSHCSRGIATHLVQQAFYLDSARPAARWPSRSSRTICQGRYYFGKASRSAIHSTSRRRDGSGTWICL
ncbi:uncharacterized protein LOC122266858 [Penaeus japonicus]|uniref:uncharacterized protein LOC122266858 n=1 Tax=Penaeus japonicus TaxID=27405 RepID=UPI001C70BC0D|nr:uncharacterized protein LOC122266858 [Penaeus japonicus]